MARTYISKNKNTLPIMAVNRANGIKRVINLDLSKTSRVMVNGWFWSEQLNGWLICNNFDYKNHGASDYDTQRSWLVNRENVEKLRVIYNQGDCDPLIRDSNDSLEHYPVIGVI